ALVGWAAGTLMAFVIGAMLASVFAVFPKFNIHRHTDEELPPHFNPLFFGHYASLPKDRYVGEMARVIKDDGSLYLTIIGDLYDQGVYLVTSKYRYLRLSYALFLAGFLCSSLALGITALAR